MSDVENPHQDGTPGRPVFVDASGRRGRWVRRGGWVLTSMLLGYLALVFIALIGPSQLGRLRVPGIGPVLPGPAAAPIGDGAGATQNPQTALEATPAPRRTPAAQRVRASPTPTRSPSTPASPSSSAPGRSGTAPSAGVPTPAETSPAAATASPRPSASASSQSPPRSTRAPTPRPRPSRTSR